MKIKDFIKSFKEEKFIEQISTLSNKLNTQRDFKYYEDFEDILDGVSESILHEHIIEKKFSIPENFFKRAIK